MSTGWFQKKDEAETPSSVKAPAKAPTGRATRVKISQLLTPETVLFAPEKADKGKVLESLAQALCAKAGLKDPQAILTKVLDREQGISTTLDTGLSLPHVRLDNLDQIVAALAVVGKGIPDPKQPDLMIRVMFLFFSPNKQESFPLHLQLLRGVSSLFQPAVIDQLAATQTAAAALDVIRKAEG
jgi:nitrogen PTS system EIIA component